MLEKIVRTLAPFLLAAALAPAAKAYDTVPKGEPDKVPEISSRWARTICHRDLTFKIAEIFREQRKATQTGADFQNQDLLFALAQGAIDEDAYRGDDRNLRFVEHFYNPDRPADQDGLVVATLNDGSHDSLSRAMKLWDQAIALYRKDSKKAAYHLLGRALHLFEDASVPEHVHLINHGPRIAKVALKGGGVFDTESPVYTEILSKLRPDDIDWDKTVIVDNGSPYEGWCKRNSLEVALAGSDPKIIPIKNLQQAFAGMANASLHPAESMREIFARNYKIGEAGNGSYARQDQVTIGEPLVSPEDSMKISSHLIPQMMGLGAGLLDLWNQSIAEPTAPNYLITTRVEEIKGKTGQRYHNVVRKTSLKQLKPQGEPEELLDIPDGKLIRRGNNFFISGESGFSKIDFEKKSLDKIVDGQYDVAFVGDNHAVLYNLRSPVRNDQSVKLLDLEKRTVSPLGISAWSAMAIDDETIVYNKVEASGRYESSIGIYAFNVRTKTDKCLHSSPRFFELLACNGNKVYVEERGVVYAFDRERKSMAELGRVQKSIDKDGTEHIFSPVVTAGGIFYFIKDGQIVKKTETSSDTIALPEDVRNQKDLYIADASDDGQMIVLGYSVAKKDKYALMNAAEQKIFLISDTPIDIIAAK